MRKLRTIGIELCCSTLQVKNVSHICTVNIFYKSHIWKTVDYESATFIIAQRATFIDLKKTQQQEEVDLMLLPGRRLSGSNICLNNDNNY